MAEPVWGEGPDGLEPTNDFIVALWGMGNTVWDLVDMRRQIRSDAGIRIEEIARRQGVEIERMQHVEGHELVVDRERPAKYEANLRTIGRYILAVDRLLEERGFETKDDEG